MSRVIRKNFIEEEIAVLETARVDWNDETAFLELGFV